jgi:hypothetical protein
MTKRELQRMRSAAWRDGVERSMERLTNEADRLEYSNSPRAQSLRDAAWILEGLVRRGR